MAVTVLDPFALPDDFDERVRGQRLDEGYGYVEVRDGALLSLNVCFRDRAVWGDGPHPTPHPVLGLQGLEAGLRHRRPGQRGNVLNTEANLALHCGCAVVGAAIRGSARLRGGRSCCSSPSRAPTATTWSRGGGAAVGGPQGGRIAKVGMIGRSMPGYEQLLVASYNPPSLARSRPRRGGPARRGRTWGVLNVALAQGIAGWQVDPIDPPGASAGAAARATSPAAGTTGSRHASPAATRSASATSCCAPGRRRRAGLVTRRPGRRGGVLAHADGEAWAAHAPGCHR